MSKIQWTDITDNPIKVDSKGTRFGGNGKPFGGVRPDDRPEMTLNVEMIQKWARMRTPKKHFIGSMTDIFGDWVEAEMIYRLLDAMAEAPLQTFQLLTKRPERVPGLLDYWLGYSGLNQLPANIWLGTSAEDQKRLDERLPWLVRSKVQTRFLSLEPLLEPIVLPDCDSAVNMTLQSGPNPIFTAEPVDYIDWVIIGGESGPRARPMELAWVRDILEQCQAAGIPAFVKQLGQRWAKRTASWHSNPHRKCGDPAEWPVYLRVRMFPGEAW